MQAIRILYLGIALFCLYSCGNEHLVPSDYVNWVNDPENGLLKKKKIQPLEIELLYKPVPYVISNEKRTNNIPLTEYNTRKEALEGLQYFTLKLGVIDPQFDITNYEITDQAQQQERLTYFSFAMQEDITLIEGKDTLPCRLYHFERSYDLTSYRTFVLAFEKKEVNKLKDKTLILDIPYFKTGPIKLNYKTSDLAKIPTLKL